MARMRRTKEQEARRFGVVLALLLGALTVLFVWRGHSGRAAAALVGAGLAAVGPFVAAPAWLRLFDLWMKLAEALGWVMTRVLLTIFFFLVLSPVALVMRLFGKRPLDLAWRDGRPSYWIEKTPPDETLQRYQSQF